MKPLKPIKIAQHNSGSARAVFTTIAPGVPIPDTKEMGVLVSTAEELLSYANQLKPVADVAHFGEFRFKSESLYLVANDGWKGHSLDVSMRLAHHFAYVTKRKTLYLNALVPRVALSRKFKALVGKKHIPNGLLQLASVPHGEAGSGLATIVEAIIKEKVEVVILNTWEWGAFSQKEKRKLFQAIDWISEISDAAIIVFTSAKAETLTHGSIRFGKLGLLADMADAVINLREPNELLPTLYNDDLTIPSDEVKPVYMTKPDEKKIEVERGAPIEINDLAEVMGTYSSPNGQLVPA